MPPRPPGRRRRPDERGGGLLSASMGVVVVLALLLLAVQVLYNLYTVSVVTAAGFDAARMVAGARGGPGAEGDAEDHARRLLGRYGERARFDWTGTDADAVRLRIRAENPSLLLPALRRSLPFSEVDRTIRVRTERFR